MDIHAHLLPSQKPVVDESVFTDNTLQNQFVSRNKPEKLTWLQDAGMGLFIHWSIDSQLGCVISHSLVGASDDYIERYYSELPKTLEKGEWDFDHLASLARLAGFRYAVLTTKHHNGFCLWPSASTDFHAGNTALGRDLVAAYVEAFRKQGIKIGFYFSPEDFWFLRREGLDITRSPKEPYSQDVMRRYKKHLETQLRELLTNYRPVDVLFFDGGETMLDENGLSLQQFCLNLSWDLVPDVLITRGAIPTPEQQLPGVGADQAWEACITLGTAWQCQPTNETYKTGEHVIRLLTDTRAKGGTLLLNVGPDERGILPREQEGVLRELALWHFINGECIHNVRPWIITSEDSIYLLKAKDSQTVYAVVTDHKDWDRGVRKDLILHSVKTTDQTQVSVLGQSGAFTEYRPDLNCHTNFENTPDGLHISAVNCQRVYCGIQWRNPLVLKITDALPAFVPMEIETGDFAVTEKDDEAEGHADAGMNDEAEGQADARKDSISADKNVELMTDIQEKTVTLTALVHSLGSFEKAQVYFEYRIYPGFALSSYETGWQQTQPKDISMKDLAREDEPQTVSAQNPAKKKEPAILMQTLDHIQKNITYQYRAIISNSQNTMKGELKLLTI